jgi:hypothetical protein
MSLHPHVIDARTGQPFQFGGDVLAVYSEAAMACGRFDASLGRVRLDAAGFDRYRQRRDAVTVRRLLGDRRDALTGQAGAFPRDLEFVYAEVLNEARRPLNAMRMFRIDTRVPLGARTHTVRRRLGVGDSQIYRGGLEIPVVRGSYVEEQFRVIHLVTSVLTDYFELLSDSFAGRSQFADDTRTAIRVLEERMNQIAFSGDGPSKVWGVLNYPHLAKTASAFAFTAANVAADPDGARAELNRLANYAIEASGGAFRPNRVATSIEVRNILTQTQNSTASDRSVAAIWLDGQEVIRQIEGAHELRGIGPAGEDGILFYDDQINSTAIVVVQPPTPLPAHAINALQNQTIYVATIGGAVMREVGNNLLAYVRAR